MVVNKALTLTPDLQRTRDAIASSTLNHGLMVMGDRWTMAILMEAFKGVHRFEQWQESLQIPRATLSERLKKLVALGLLGRETPAESVGQKFYHLTHKGLGLYPAVLMVWLWEKRWGSRQKTLPSTLVHTVCGQRFSPVLACTACSEKTGLSDLRLELDPNAALLASAIRRERTGRIAGTSAQGLGLGLRVDRWALLIITAIILGCHYFDQIAKVLGISSAVLTRRLNAMVEMDLLLCQTDQQDARRFIYRLTPASRDLLGYLVCFSGWASREFLRQPSSIRPVHKACAQTFVAQVVCSACQQVVRPWEVDFSYT